MNLRYRRVVIGCVSGDVSFQMRIMNSTKMYNSKIAILLQSLLKNLEISIFMVDGSSYA